MPARRRRAPAQKSAETVKEKTIETQPIRSGTEILQKTITSENVYNRPRFSMMPDVGEDSVIMLSSAETTLVNDPSLMMLTAVDFRRPSTRLSNIDMTLEETARTTTRRSTGAYNAEETDMSLVNIVQTPGVQRARPKSSIVIRRTRSKSLMLPPVGEVNQVLQIRGRSRNINSDEFSTITKRSRKVASRPLATGRISEEVQNSDENSNRTQRSTEKDVNKSSGESLNVNQNNEPSKISERQSRRSANKLEELAVSRVRSRSASRRRPALGRDQDRVLTRSASRGRQPAPKETSRKVEKPSKETSVKKKSKRLKPLPVVEQNQPVSNKKTPSLSNVSKSKEAEQDPAKQPEDSDTGPEQSNQMSSESNLDQSSISMYVSKRRRKLKPQQTESSSEKEQSHNEQMDTNTFKSPDRISTVSVRKRKIAAENSSQNSINSQSEGDYSNLENSQFSNVSKRKRPKLTPKDRISPSSSSENGRASDAVSNITQIVAPPVTEEVIVPQDIANQGRVGRGRSRKKSVSNTVDSNVITKSTIRTRSASRGRNAILNTTEETSLVTKRVRNKRINCPCCVTANTASKNKPATSPVIKSHPRKSNIESTESEAQSETTRSPSVSVQKNKSAARLPKTRSKSASRTTVFESKSESPIVSSVSPSQPTASLKRKPRSRNDDHPKRPALCSIDAESNPESPAVPSAVPEAATTQQDPSLKRNGGRSRTRDPKPSRIRSKSVLRNASSTTSSKPSLRSRSVPRNVVLSPARRFDEQLTSGDGSHVPVYRKYAEEVLARTESVTNLTLIPPEPIPTDEDIYAFDSPSQHTSDAAVGAKKKGSTAKKRARLTKRNTPAKKAHLNMFGTDMDRINKIVKRIGGGPVRQPAPSGAGSKETVDKATLTAFMQSQKPPKNAQRDLPRSISPPASNYDAGDDHHNYDDDNDFDTENIPTVEMPVPVPVSPAKINPQIQRVLQQKVVTPDKTQPNATLNFSPLGASSPWRVHSENILPKTFYFSRSKDMLPTYESDVVVRHNDDRQKSPTKIIEPMAAPPRKTISPSHQQPVPSAAKSDAMFRGIQKSYEQLKVTSEMSDKLISAMRQYKSNIHNQTSSFSEGPIPENEQLIAKFREYETNMKKTYLKLKQWYERSQQTLRHSIRTIEQVSAMPKTKAQKEVLENFHRNSERFISMINELESAMNDSNIENISPPRTADTRDRQAFKEIIQIDRNATNQNRSPLKTLDIVNVVPQFSPVKSPLVKASFSAFSNSGKQQSLSKSKERFSRLSLVKNPGMQLSQPALVEDPSVIEIADTFAEPHCVSSAEFSSTDRTAAEAQPNKDLFGFEDDVENDFAGPTPLKITKETLKERLQSVRKLLPQRPQPNQTQARSASAKQTQVPKIFGSPKKLRPIQSVFTSSTPLVDKNTRSRRGQPEPDPNVSAIVERREDPRKEQEQLENRNSLPGDLFDELVEEAVGTKLTSVNRTYSRIPQRNPKRKRNIYLADLGLSDDEDNSESSSSDSESANQAAEAARIKQQTKKRRVAQAKKKHPVDQTNEFKQFVSEFNSMCEEVNRYQLVIEKPAVRQRV